MAGKTYPELTAISDVVGTDLLAAYRSPGPLKRVTAAAAADYFGSALVNNGTIPTFSLVANAETATIQALTQTIQTLGYAAQGSGGATYVRVSLADIVSAGYPAAAYFRSTDRYMPDLSTNATNGGYWLIASLDLRPENFGSLASAASTTAAFKAMWDFATATKRTIILAGDYAVSGALATPLNLASGSLDVVCEGDVTITYDAAAVAITTPLLSFGTIGHHVASVRGGSLTINLNGKAPIGFDCNNATSASGTAGGTCVFSCPVAVLNAHAGATSDGAAHGLRINGPYSAIRLVRPKVSGVSRDASFLSSGLCQGVKIAGSMGVVRVIDPDISLVTCPQSLPGDLGQDADGISVLSRPVGGNYNVSDKRLGTAFMEGGVFTDCQGRSIKLQISNARIVRPKFVRNALGWATIDFGKEIDAQLCENVTVHDYEYEYAAGVLSENFVPITAQMGLPAGYESYFGVFGGKGVSLSRMYHLATITAYSTANYADSFKFEMVGGVHRTGVGWAAGDQFFRGIVGHDLSKLKSAAAGIVGEVVIRDTDTENVYPAYAYASASADMADAAVGGVLRLTVENNQTSGAVGANTQPSRSISGTTIAEYAARKLVNNFGYYSVITSAVTVDFATATPGDRMVVRASDLTAVNGPALPTGVGDFLLIEIGDIYSSGSSRPSARITQVFGGAQVWVTSGNGAWEQPIVNIGRVGVTFVGDAAATLTVRSSNINQVWTTTLTADRAVTLSTTDARAGDVFKISRPATGAFNLNVGTGPLKALPAGSWCEVTYTGAAWVLTGYGAL